MNKLCIHAIRSEVMIFSKTCYTAVPQIYIGNDFINVVSHTTRLGLVIDKRLTWSTIVDHVKKSFAQRLLKTMLKLPVKGLEEIYFKSIVPAVTCGIVVWGKQ